MITKIIESASQETSSQNHTGAPLTMQPLKRLGAFSLLPKEKDTLYPVFSGIPKYPDLLELVQGYKDKFEEEAPPAYSSTESLSPTAPKM